MPAPTYPCANCTCRKKIQIQVHERLNFRISEGKLVLSSKGESKQEPLWSGSRKSFPTASGLGNLTRAAVACYSQAVMQTPEMGKAAPWARYADAALGAAALCA